jgi:hypothetical protein
LKSQDKHLKYPEKGLLYLRSIWSLCSFGIQCLKIIYILAKNDGKNMFKKEELLMPSHQLFQI